MGDSLMIVSFAGLARAGKTTAADILHRIAEARGVEVVRLPFAAPLKDGLAMMGIHKDRHPDLYRKAAQVLGTDIVRAYDDGWWVRQWQEALPNHPCLVIADDARFDNEVGAARDAGGIVVLIDAGDRLDTTGETYRHASESLASTIRPDAILLNAGTLGEFEAAVTAWGNQLDLGGVYA